MHARHACRLGHVVQHAASATIAAIMAKAVAAKHAKPSAKTHPTMTSAIM